MRYGFTTGSCAAAAAKAAAFMLLTGREKTEISINTPKGMRYQAKLKDICRGEREVSCAVEKDGGDDPDITTGLLIYAKASYLNEEDTGAGKIMIEGGQGIGRVTRPGLDQPVGNAAINHVPREMIQKEALEACAAAGYDGSLKIEIYAPRGEEIGRRTYNPRLGIVGGISILGTSGVVEPMSSQALLDTIRLELRQRRTYGYHYVAVSPGNYGQDFMKEAYGYDLERSIKCSNFIGETIDMAAELGYRKMLLTGHIGKLIKVAGGIMNTHSREADARMELLAAFSIKEGVDVSLVSAILDCVSTEEAVPILEKSGKLGPVMERVVTRICDYMEYRAKGRMEMDCILYASGYGELAKSRGAEKWFTLLGQEQAQSI